MRGEAMRGAVTRAVYLLALSSLALFGMAWPLADAARARGTWAPKLTAVYKLRMHGLEVATFNFSSSVTGDTYALAGQAKMAWGLGLLKYTGTFSSSGRLSGAALQPASYAYDWRVNAKSGAVNIAYGPGDRAVGGAVKSVEVQPPNVPSPDVVPVKPEHLRSVFDPLTSLIVLSRLGDGPPCQRTIAVYEGKQRFDIAFTPLREEKVVEPKPSGQPVTAYVCRVKYTPVSGHKMNKETQLAVKAEGIEVALRPVPSADVLVPYRIVLPTPLGSAVLTAHQVDIIAPGNRVIALTH